MRIPSCNVALLSPHTCILFVSLSLSLSLSVCFSVFFVCLSVSSVCLSLSLSHTHTHTHTLFLLLTDMPLLTNIYLMISSQITLRQTWLNWWWRMKVSGESTRRCSREEITMPGYTTAARLSWTRRDGNYTRQKAKYEIFETRVSVCVDPDFCSI